MSNGFRSFSKRKQGKLKAIQKTLNEIAKKGMSIEFLFKYIYEHKKLNFRYVRRKNGKRQYKYYSPKNLWKMPTKYLDGAHSLLKEFA